MFGTAKNTKEQSKYDRIHYVGGRVSIAEYIKEPPAGSIKMTVTPELAAEMLEYNTRNRPLAKATVANYARQMAAGDWVYSRVPVIFSDEGRLIDGQHRLAACVESGATVEMDVAFGAPDSAFSYIDIGKKRGASDIFGINGVPNYAQVSSITSILHQYLKVGRVSQGGMNTVVRPTPAELYDFFCENPDIMDGLPVYWVFKKNRIANPSVMAGLYVICARKNRAMADRFFEVAGTGLGAEGKNDPAFKLRELFIAAAAAGNKYDRDATGRLTIDAWNRARRGITGRGLKLDPGAKYPRVQ